MVIGTGMRTGELLAMRWDQLDSSRNIVAISRTIAQDRDGKFFVQEFTKTDAGFRELHLPAHVIDMLMRRRIASYSEFVFCSSMGTFRHPNNYRTTWRAALAETPWKGTTPKSFRKTVATVVCDALGVEAAKDQLGYESEKTTLKRYADQVHRGPSAAPVLDRLFS